MLTRSGTIWPSLLTASLVLLLLYAGELLFVPLFYGLFIAIVLYPVTRWLEHHRVPRPLAIALGLTLVLLLFLLLLWLFVLQLQALWKDLPLLQQKLLPALAALQEWLRTHWGITLSEQHNWLLQLGEKAPGIAGNLVAGTLHTTATVLFMVFIIPVFAALFLYNRGDFVLFLEKLAGRAYADRLHHLLRNIIHTYFHFIRGMLLVYLIVGILNSIGLLALGIEHAILFGFLTAIMTIIPYVGIFVSALLPITLAWVTKDSIWYPLGVVGVFGFVQYLEANVIFPKVVAAQLNVSTWATLVAFIAGGIVWGVNGMILFIPFVAILKMVSDVVPEWAALNVLLRRTGK
ncbi:MAG TPA: AI-2E family transporter [Lacibacter sp.]|nr:AI-2E family transporter [Lacibacter sp.]HMO90058.1 AI-2E family transporter [Lacibacter sp.]HMP85812.1 AI-2E family transporter [Lacibacter sp.]